MGCNIARSGNHHAANHPSDQLTFQLTTGKLPIGRKWGIFHEIKLHTRETTY